MKGKQIVTLTMALLLSFSATAFAATGADLEGNDEWKGPEGSVGADGSTPDNGHTTFSIIEAKQDPNNISFTVPLYVTMAVTNGDTQLITPTNYGIVNTSKDKVVGETTVADTAFEIGVVGMKFSKLAGTYMTATDVTAAPTNTNKHVKLSVAGVIMPQMLTPGTKGVDFISATSDFYDATKKAYKVIQPDASLNIAVQGQLGAAATVTTNTSAVPQFAVKYVVSALVPGADPNFGKPLGFTYAGSNHAEAGDPLNKLPRE